MCVYLSYYSAINYEILKLTRFGGENAEAIVPKSAGHQKSAVHSSNKAIATNLELLAKIVA